MFIVVVLGASQKPLDGSVAVLLLHFQNGHLTNGK